MEEWIKISTLYESEEKAAKAAQIIAATESKIASKAAGAQYKVETRIEKTDEKWQIFWRKIYIGPKSGCGGCSSCEEDKPVKQDKSKVIPFRKKSV